MRKLKLAVLIAIVAVIAALGAAWKWSARLPGTPKPTKVAGWTWGDSSPSNEAGNPGTSQRHHGQ